jgi:hypothetical protein
VQQAATAKGTKGGFEVDAASQALLCALSRASQGQQVLAIAISADEEDLCW